MSETPACEHDWRVNPNLVLASNPPKREVVCATCGARRYEVCGSYVDAQAPVERWPKASSASFPSLASVAAHGDHSPESWADIERIRAGLKEQGFPFPTLRSVGDPEAESDV